MMRSRRVRVAVTAVFVVAVAGVMWTYDAFFREEPPPYFESDEDHFLFGSVGTEVAEGVPYWIWLVLPRIFPDLLPGPGGYASLGLLAKDGREMPVGLSKVTVGFPRVGINCALCHTASVRTSPDALPTLVAGGPAHQTALQQYVRFLTSAAADPRFTAGIILSEIAKNYRLSFRERVTYRFAVIPITRHALLRLREESAWMDRRPDWGRGRIDPFNPVKFRRLGQPIDDTIGSSDMVALWNYREGERQAYHWDGLNTLLREVVISSAVGDGASRGWVDRDFAKWNNPGSREASSLRRIQSFISANRPPAYPFPIDRALAAAGSAIYAAECANCHAEGGARRGTVVPVEEVGTDRHRLDMWTASAAAAYNTFGEGRPWKFSSFRTTAGYVAVSHDGLWLRAPYLHNGSVPSLTDMLEVPESRTKRFWRGYDVYDDGKVGFVSDGAGAQRVGTLYDTAAPGNANTGHLYGTALPPESKRALIEYLKTL